MKFISFDELKSDYGIPFSKPTIWRKQKANPPKFPHWTRLGPQHNAIPDTVLCSYTEARAAGYSEEEATALAERVRPAVTGHAALEAGYATAS